MKLRAVQGLHLVSRNALLASCLAQPRLSGLASHVVPRREQVSQGRHARQIARIVRYTRRITFRPTGACTPGSCWPGRSNPLLSLASARRRTVRLASWAGVSLPVSTGVSHVRFRLERSARRCRARHSRSIARARVSGVSRRGCFGWGPGCTILRFNVNRRAANALLRASRESGRA